MHSQQHHPEHPSAPHEGQQAGYQGPPIIINNSVNASAMAFGRYGGRRRQSAWMHFILFLCTAGIGNVIYARYVSSWNRRRGL
ncbi:hypothetical protein NJL88_12985 [Streptomyces sp. DK15]|uniref:hypothetical protein n=1 Tax=Streptomyces sp. DK15 TaxID=2957499 RepID=UPI0029B64CB5|nr:hypothetical protein [Streptomyces sp. DK15]MDX2390958.1 hypothetical protein [Streptomyces sp. DK15]